MVLKARGLFAFLAILCVMTGIIISFLRFHSTQQPAHDSVFTDAELLDAKFHIERAHKYFYTDVNIYAAINEYQKALAVEPNNIQALAGLAEVLECAAPSLSSREATKHIYYQILAFDPENHHAYISLLSLLTSGSEHENAEAERLISKAPASLLKDPGFARIRATILVNQNKPSEAISVLEQALKQYPNDTQLLYFLAYVHYLENNFTKAKTYIIRGGELAQDNDDPLLTQIHSLYELIDSASKTGTKPGEYY